MSIKTKKGFTLIEIVIVLAIAALILIIVFLAVAGAQRSRRDTQRKADLDKIAAQLENWASNHDADYPLATEWLAFATGTTSYLKLDQGSGVRTMADPFGASYTTNAGAASIPPCATSGGSNVQIPNASGNVPAGIAYASVGSVGSNRKYEVRICLEAGNYTRKQ